MNAFEQAQTTYCEVCDSTPCNKQSEYFGVCPTCHKNDGCINIGQGHWMYCKAHKVMWYIGSNLFSAWREETLEYQKARWVRLGMTEFLTIEDALRGVQPCLDHDTE